MLKYACVLQLIVCLTRLTPKTCSMTRQSNDGMLWSALTSEYLQFPLTRPGSIAGGCIQTLQVHPEDGSDFHCRTSRFPCIYLLGRGQHRRTFRGNHMYAASLT